MKYGNEVTSKYAKIGDISFCLKPLDIYNARRNSVDTQFDFPICLACCVIAAEYKLVM